MSLTIEPLHPTFAARVLGVDFSKPIPVETLEAIKAAIAKVT